MGEDEQQVERLEEPERRNFREAAVRTDASPLLLSMVRRWRQRLPGDERFGDPLSTAGEAPVNVIARHVSAMQPDRPSVLQEVGLGALQVWQSLSEASGRGRGDAEVAILFTDLVGFSSWALEAGDAAAVELLRDVGVIVEAVVAEHEGRIVKRLGDGVMAVFGHPQAAVEAGLEMQDRLGLLEVAGHRPRMRAGVHHGRPRKLGNDYLGVDVNVAARIGAAAGPGEVLVSEHTCGLLDQARLTVGRSKRLKAPGAPRELRVCAVRPPDGLDG
jgi:adenylate cyclase